MSDVDTSETVAREEIDTDTREEIDSSTDAEDLLVEEVSIDGMCGVY